ncbi:hypothetical protein ACU686_26530 [Yinghuangia aomiensis]
MWIYYRQAVTLDALARSNRKGREEFIRAQVEAGKAFRAAKAEARRAAPGRWPTLAAVVADAVAQRLADPDLAGPWAPLTEREQLRMASVGRWPGPDEHEPLSQRNYPLPTDLFMRLRTASWRVSEEPIEELERRRWTIAPAEYRRIAALIHSPGRIVRQALDAYGPEYGAPRRRRPSDAAPAEIKGYPFKIPASCVRN